MCHKQQIIQLRFINLKCLITFQELDSLFLYCLLSKCAVTWLALIPVSLLDRLMIIGDVCSNANEETAISALKISRGGGKKQNAPHNDITIIYNNEAVVPQCKLSLLQVQVVPE